MARKGGMKTNTQTQQQQQQQKSQIWGILSASKKGNLGGWKGLCLGTKQTDI